MNKKATLAVAATLAVTLVAGCSGADSAASSEGVATADAAATFDDSASSSVALESEAVAMTTEDNAATHDSTADYEYNETDVIEISLGASITTDSGYVAVDGSTATISAAGTYRISGTVANGQILVDAGDSAVVQLVLDGVDITNADGAAIAVMSAEKAIVILADGRRAQRHALQQVGSHHHR